MTVKLIHNSLKYIAFIALVLTFGLSGIAESQWRDSSSYTIPSPAGKKVKIPYFVSDNALFLQRGWVGFTNSYITSTLPDSIHQGYATDGRRHYLFGTRKIYKYNSDWTRCDSNTNIFSTIPLAVDHGGDGAYYQGKLYVPIEYYYGSGGEGQNYYIGVFDTTGSMSLIGYHDVSAYVRNGDELGGLEVYNDTIYGVHYNPSAYRKITRFNISTFARIDTIPLSMSLEQVQGVVYHNDTLFCATNVGKLYAVDKNNGNSTLYWVDKIAPATASHEGIDWSQTELRWLIDNGGIGFEKVYYYSPYGYQTGSIINKYSVSADSVIVGKFRNPSLYTGTTLKVSQRAEIDSLVIPYHSGHTFFGNPLLITDNNYGVSYPVSNLHINKTVTNLGNIPFITLQAQTTTNTATDGSSIDFVNSSQASAVTARIRSTRVAAGALSDLRFSISPSTFGVLVDMLRLQKDSSATFMGKIIGQGLSNSLITNFTWNGTSIDTAYTNAVSKITAGYGVTATKNAKDYTITFDSATVRSKFVPYSGANASVNLGAQTITTTGAGTFGTVSGTKGHFSDSIGISTNTRPNLTLRKNLGSDGRWIHFVNTSASPVGHTLSWIGTSNLFQFYNVTKDIRVDGRDSLGRFWVGGTAANPPSTTARVQFKNDANNVNILEFYRGSSTSSVASIDSVGSSQFTGQKLAIDTTSVDKTLGASNYTILCSPLTNITITLPASASHVGRIYNIKKVNSTGASITIDGNSAETIDGNLTITFNTQWTSYQIQSTGTSWVIL